MLNVRKKKKLTFNSLLIETHIFFNQKKRTNRIDVALYQKELLVVNFTE